MSLFESLNNSSESGIDKGKDYVDATYKYLKLKSFHILSLSLSTIIKVLFIGGLAIISLFFFSIALAIYVGEYYNSFSLGCVFVGGLFLLIGIIMYLFRKKIDTIVIENVAKKFSK